ncbi:MAG: Holliday junction branch migration DNA helicase RuvB [Candidatus Wildermuthbacteria bacterium]|nr:Holliday junction branch migration DNA helicase RuvB [Candidatus Wildermuthbacteria bacterium]
MIVKTSLAQQADDEILDKNLRPSLWDEFLGQKKLKESLNVIIQAAKMRGEGLEHLLFYGNSGLGKTSLAQVVANSMGVPFHRTSGPALKMAGDIASVLTNLQDRDILFIDEIHRVPRQVLETLYSAMEDFKLHLVLGKGPLARTMELPLPSFTIIGATTKMGLLPSPFRNRFGATFHIDFYQTADIENILRRSAKILRVDLTEEALVTLASRSRFTPRVANRILKRVRDFATVHGNKTVAREVAVAALDFLEIDELGLEKEDRNILEALVARFSGGPVGIEALAAAVQEEEDTLLDLYEPYLSQIGFLERTPRGRVATQKAYAHLGIAKSRKHLV